MPYMVPSLQIASAAAAFELNDRQRFRGFFRTIPSYDFVAPSLAQVARQFGWTQLAIITQRESVFTVVSVGICCVLVKIHFLLFL